MQHISHVCKNVWGTVCVCGGGGANWGCTKWQCTLMRASGALRVGVACALSPYLLARLALMSAV